jgi:transposase-like protein
MHYLTTSPIDVFTGFFNNLYQRIRVPSDTKAFAVLTHLEGLSVRAIQRSLESLGVKVSREAIRKWIQRIKGYIDRITIPRYREIVAVDESVLKVNGRHIYVYAAIDVFTREIVAISASLHREYHDTTMFLRKMLSMCENKPFVLVDRGMWYPYALQRLGIPYACMKYSFRNRIERWFRTLKDRTKRFYNNFPYRSLEKINEAEKFFELFVFWYNCIRKHMTLGRTPIDIKEVIA